VNPDRARAHARKRVREFIRARYGRIHAGRWTEDNTRFIAISRGRATGELVIVGFPNEARL